VTVSEEDRETFVDDDYLPTPAFMCAAAAIGDAVRFCVLLEDAGTDSQTH
jgi:hypothetical protein